MLRGTWKKKKRMSGRTAKYNGKRKRAARVAGYRQPGKTGRHLLREQVFLRQMLALSRQNDEYTDILYALSAQEDGIAASSLVMKIDIIKCRMI